MRPRVKSVTFTTPGQSIAVSDHVTLIVGPNNVGKSAVLSNIHQELTLEPYQVLGEGGRPVSFVTATMPPVEELASLVQERAQLRPPGQYMQGYFSEPVYFFANGVTIAESTLNAASARSNRFGNFGTSMVVLLPPEGRGGVLGSTTIPDLMSQQARSPMQMLYDDRELEAKISGYMTRAFGRPLTVNRHAGLNMHLHIGSVGAPEPRVGEKGTYTEEIMNLPMLSAQGAGMQAFMGTLLVLAANRFDIVLLDEPETFLHPPQARLLGEVVAEMSRLEGSQVIAATHSDDFVQGVLNASKGDSDVSVARITRPNDGENRVSQVPPRSITSLYRDPLMRYSDIMKGIFYKGVVLCEAESDCTYYSAVLGQIESSDRRSSSDLLFTQCGGKDRFSKAYDALASAAVPTAVIADIDLLADKAKFKTLFEAMGGTFSLIESAYNVLDSSVRAQTRRPNRLEAGRRIREIIDGSTQKQFAKAELLAISTLISTESGWRQIKRKGRGAIDGGDPLVAFNRLQTASAAVGLFILGVGELERFHPEIGGTKQEWLRKVIEQQLFCNETEAHGLLRDILKFVSSKQ